MASKDVVRVYVKVAAFQKEFFERTYGSNVVRRNSSSDVIYHWFMSRLSRKRVVRLRYEAMVSTDPIENAIIFEIDGKVLQRHGYWMRLGTRNALAKIINQELVKTMKAHVRAKLSETPRYGEVTAAISNFQEAYAISEDDYAFESLVKEWGRR